jgi:pyruvate/2-oxoacid:ferredoxin oxidoreductase beta subunit
MTTEQFDLSNKKRKIKEGEISLYAFAPEDIKEFIRELKKRISKRSYQSYNEYNQPFREINIVGVNEEIDKLAGKELIEDTHESGRVKGGSEK